MTIFNITDIPEFSTKERIVVVGIIGKSPYRYPNKTTPLLPAVQSEKNGIECHWDERQGLLYLHAVTYLDTKRLAELACNLDGNSKSTKKEADAAHWLVASGELAADSCRTISLLFQLCHIVVLSSPSSSFDLSYLQLFKAIDGYRTELASRITAALSEIGAEGSWEKHGRTSCPRLLFHFRRAPTPLKRNPAALKRLEHAVEDQLYFILRKTRIITNVCAKSLFAIPKNEEFVYMSTDTSSNARDVSTLVRGLVAMCAGAEPEVPTERPTFKAFLQAHVDRAFNEGFDDNVGKFAMSTSFFELPSASSWREAARALTPLFLEESSSSDDGEDGELSGALAHALATDVRFSAARCAKVLPIAQASYTEGLPSHYSSQHHAHKVGVALGVLETMARGPLAGGAAERLRAACAQTWKSRTLCEALSLTGYGCIHPDHDGSKEHCSGVRYVSACECGRTRLQREDPYTVRAANCSFYATAADHCAVCPTLQHHDFPIFEPSTPTFRAASVKGVPSQEEWSGGSGGRSGGAESWSGGDALSPGLPPDEEEEPYVVAVRDCSTAEKVMSRQPSTTEYLPGMLHTGSPDGLLPAFPSWSLRCLGASSLYSHALGLPEQLQPGLLPHTNYLLPWDAPLPSHTKIEQASAWRAALSHTSRGRGKSQPPHLLTVKIFIGFEYECLRGHRFMMSSPESVVSGGGSAATGGAGGAGGAGAGAGVAASDMPLYVACVCLGGAALTAQLTRIHVVTPKSPIHVTLDPKVQPVAGGSIFVPQPPGSPVVKLTASTYWVLRLPHVYSDERGTLPRPRTPPTHPGYLLAPLFGLQE